MKKSRKQLKQERVDNANINEDGLSYHEISKILNIPVHVVKRIESDALRKLRQPNSEANKKLHKYMEIHLKPNDTIDI